jgi:hypothetical protein
MELYFILILNVSFKIVIFDFITDLPFSMKEGYFKFYNVIFVIVCKFTKFAVYIFIRKDVDAAGLIRKKIPYKKKVIY